ncbi:MAG TPA: SdpI family protein [Clostridia bacterium]|nr:SdpI family protein [Clostridia bacterium]
MKVNPFILFLLFLSFAGVLIVYPGLPSEIPTHWDIGGNINEYSPKWAILLLAALPVAIYLMMVFLPKIDPKKKSYDMHKKAYEIAKVFITLIMSVLVWISILVSKGVNLDVGLIVSLMVGVLFITLGNYMSQIRHNYFFGIRTPWTLASEKVWKSTHRVGGYCFIGMGMGMIIVNLLRDHMPSWIMLPIIIFGVGMPIVYSYFEYKRIFEKNEK